MGRSSVIIDPVCAGHDNPEHLESNARLLNAISGIPKDIPLRNSEPASLGDVQRVHNPQYISRLERRCAAVTSVDWMDADTYITRHSFAAAMHAAGAAIAAVERSEDGEHCFALIRPPGHHAEYDRAMGFCLINNVAVAAKKALKTVDKVAIVDWDAHHGNGTQNCFYGTDRVLYCSLHQEHIFPYSGSVLEAGVGEGKGFTINAPLPSRSTIADYSYVLSEIVAPVIGRFAPDVIIISAGLDILYDDPLGMMRIMPKDLGILTGIIARASGLPLALVLEGGYGKSNGEAVRHIFAALANSDDAGVPGLFSERTRQLVSFLKKTNHLA